MNKKSYLAPQVNTYQMVGEGLIAASPSLQIGDDEKLFGNQQLYDEMESSWSNDIWNKDEE